MQEKRSVRAWFSKHKDEVIIVGVVVTAVVGGSIVAKNWDTIKAMIDREKTSRPTYKSLPPITQSAKAVVQIVDVQEQATKVVDVREHLRTLSFGHPSAIKLAEAAKAGIELADNQTIVSAHQRCYVA